MAREYNATMLGENDGTRWAGPLFSVEIESAFRISFRARITRNLQFVPLLLVSCDLLLSRV